jgi:hypothetical protein
MSSTKEGTQRKPYDTRYDDDPDLLAEARAADWDNFEPGWSFWFKRWRDKGGTSSGWWIDRFFEDSGGTR